jgi:lipoyl(octanoyl) transferase
MPWPVPQWLGRLDYRWALRLQRARRRSVLAGTAPEALWMLEHPAVVTLGKRGGEVLALPPGVPVVPVERGGLATVHLPGQLVAYAVVDLARRGVGVRDFVWCLEQGVCDYLAELGVQAHRRPGAPGVWVGDDKIAAVGIHVRRGVTLHGLALNLDPDLAAFQWIVPCGLVGTGVTSVRAIRGGAPDPWSAHRALGHHLHAVFVDTQRGRG